MTNELTIYRTTAETYTGKINVINVEMPTTGDELADLKTATAAARGMATSATWIGNDYAETGESAVFSFEVKL